MKDETFRRAIVALGRALTAAKPGLTLSSSGYVDHWSENLIPGTDPAWFETELNEGDGAELKKKFKAAHSSAALAVNTFARFKTAPTSLSVANSSGHKTFRFEAKCPAGIRGGRSPNLDLLAQGATILGVESKCTEHLKRHIAKFSTAYNEQIEDSARRDSSWFRLMQALASGPDRYCYLDAAQLIKHAFGLAHCFPNKNVTLLYIYWEPKNASDFFEFRDHRTEVNSFKADVQNSSPAFDAIGYRDLWDQWQRLSTPPWLAEHVTALRARYDLVI